MEHVRSPGTATVKHELDIQQTVLQPPDMHYKPRRCKLEPADTTLPITEDIPQSHELVLRREEFPQQSGNDLIHYSPRTYPQASAKIAAGCRVASNLRVTPPPNVSCNTKIRDENEFNIAFCRLIENYPVLYDPSHQEYCNRNVQDKVWREISKKLNETGTAGGAFLEVKVEAGVMPSDGAEEPLGQDPLDSDYDESDLVPLKYNILKKEVVVEISFGDETPSLSGVETTRRVSAESENKPASNKLNGEGTTEAVKANGSRIAETTVSRVPRTSEPAETSATKVVPAITVERSDCHNSAVVKEEPMDCNNDIANEQVCVHANGNPSGAERHARAAENKQAEIIIKIEPTDFDEEAMTSEDGSGKVPEDLRSSDVHAVKQELEIELSVLQPPDMRCIPRPCKPEPADTTIPITEDDAQGHGLLVKKGKCFTQQLNKDLYNFPGSLPQGTCGPTSQQDTQPVKIVSNPAHTNASKQINAKTFELLARIPGISASIVHPDMKHLQHISITSTSHGDNSINHVNPKKFKCDFCYQVFSWKSNLLDHMRLHNYKLSSQNITELSKEKKGNNSLNLPNRIAHSGEKPFGCETCGKRFSQKSSLNMHMNIHNDPLKCQFCDKKYSNNSHLLRHMRVHTSEKKFECISCGEKFKRRSHLSKHMRVHSGEKPFECESCDKRFSYQVSLIRHTRLHTGEKYFECKFCGKRFRDNSTLDLHMRVHTGERPFECKSCDKKFYQSSHLNRHMLVHIVGKPFEPESCGEASVITDIGVPADEKHFVCKYCCKIFSDKSTLAKHVRVHTGEKPFECGSCDKKFTQSSHLNRHMLVHTGERPFECAYCGKRFSQRGTLITHIRVHTLDTSQCNEKRFRCESCDMRFYHNSTLIKHVRVHTGEKPFECESCGKRFNQTSHLKRHVRIHTDMKAFGC